MSWCVLDIETIPSLDPAIMTELAAEIEPDKNLKDPEKIRANVAKKLEKAYNETSLDPLRGSICAIGVMTAKGDHHIFTAYGGMDMAHQHALEEQAIRDANEVLSGSVIAWNGRDFDFRFLGIRSLRYADKAKLRSLAPYLSLGIDPMVKLFGPRGYVKQSTFAKHLGIQCDTSFDGSMVAAAYARGEYSKITNHLSDDVRTLREIVLRCKEVLW